MRHSNFMMALLYDYNDDFCVFDTPDRIMEGIKPAFGSPGGKFFVAGKLVKMFPEHKRYVESFIGGASILCRKKPSEEEFINDRDIEIYRCYKFIQDLTEDQLKALEAKEWTTKETVFNKLLADYKQNGIASDPVDQFYQHVYLKAASDAGEMRSYDGRAEGDVMKVPSRLMKLKERFKNVTIENMDYREFIKKYANEESFTFMDPPYPSARMTWKFCPTQKEFESFSKTVPGKWMITYEVCDGWKESQYTRKLLSQYNLAAPSQKHMSRKNELLVVNYDLSKIEESKFIASIDSFDSDYKSDIMEFISSNDMVIKESFTDVAETLKKVLSLHAEKRRGNDIKESFDQIKASFKKTLSSVLHEGAVIKMKRMPPYGKELFDEFTTYEHTDDGFSIKMKESEQEVGKFVYYTQWWKSKAAESVIDRDFVISTDISKHFICDSDIFSESCNFYLRNNHIAMESITESVKFLAPDCDSNKTSNPSWIKKLGEGKIAITAVSPTEKNIEIMRGDDVITLNAKRANESSDFWQIKKGSLS